MYVLQRGGSGDGCELASTLCQCDLRKVFSSEFGQGCNE